jgi:LysM repeat protein
MLPFFLLVGVFLVFVWRITQPSKAPSPVKCEDPDTTYTIVRGDTCWTIANGFGIDVARLKGANHRLDCDQLEVGRAICVP